MTRTTTFALSAHGITIFSPCKEFEHNHDVISSCTAFTASAIGKLLLTIHESIRMMNIYFYWRHLRSGVF
jgi:hypothetical protein